MRKDLFCVRIAALKWRGGTQFCWQKCPPTEFYWQTKVPWIKKVRMENEGRTKKAVCNLNPRIRVKKGRRENEEGWKVRVYCYLLSGFFLLSFSIDVVFFFFLFEWWWKGFVNLAALWVFSFSLFLICFMMIVLCWVGIVSAIIC